MNLLIPLTAEEQRLAEAYAKAHSLSLEAAFKEALFRHIGDKAPNQITRSAIQKMDKDTKNSFVKTYDSFNEILKELDFKETSIKPKIQEGFLKMNDMTETDYLMLSEANRNHILKGIAEAQDPLAQLSLNKRKGYAEGRFEGRVESTADLIKAGLITFDSIKESNLFTENELTAISIKLFKNA